MNRGAIGIFDSGIGGLTVASEVVRKMPHEDLIYLGDTARLPYGTRSATTVVRYACRAAELLLRTRSRWSWWPVTPRRPTPSPLWLSSRSCPCSV
jgi:glutamate racemase